MEYVSINPMQIEAMDLSPAEEPHELVSFQVFTSVRADRQVSAFVIGRKQPAMLVIDVLATLIFIDTPNYVAMRISEVVHGFTSSKFYIGAGLANTIFHSH